MSNESIADRIVDGTAEEVNLNGNKPAAEVFKDMNSQVNNQLKYTAS